MNDKFKLKIEQILKQYNKYISSETLNMSNYGGVYCEDSNIAVTVKDSVSPYGVLPWAIDPDGAARLWRLSEELTGVTFQIY
jgi:hypothetical protein